MTSICSLLGDKYLIDNRQFTTDQLVNLRSFTSHFKEINEITDDGDTNQNVFVPFLDSAPFITSLSSDESNEHDQEKWKSNRIFNAERNVNVSRSTSRNIKSSQKKFISHSKDSNQGIKKSNPVGVLENEMRPFTSSSTLLPYSERDYLNEANNSNIDSSVDNEEVTVVFHSQRV